MLSRPTGRLERIARGLLSQIASTPPAPSGGEIVDAIHFDVTTVSPWVLIPIPSGSTFNRAAVLIETPFNDATASLKLGTSLDSSKFLGAPDSSLGVANCYDSGELHILASDVLILTLDKATSTVGEGYVFYRILT